MKLQLTSLLVFAFMCASSLCAQRPRAGRAAEQSATPSTPETGPSSTPFPGPPAEDKAVKTQHTIRVNGQELHYTATAGTLVIKKEDEKPRASMFYVAYTLDGADAAKRPITYTFNGGPGSSSVWLHLGALGPRRVPLTSEGQSVPPPYRLVDNEETALSFTDLVFIDPVTTGFSRHAPGEDPKQFHGLEGDLDSVSEFIRLWTSRNQRWVSPKFLAGESYGTTRAAALSEYLIRKHGIYLNGITLISSILNFETASFVPGNDMGFILFLPTYTAAAWYHKKLSPDLQGSDIKTVTDAARTFAGGPYTLALMKGDQLTESERKEMAQQVAKYTGLSPKFVEQANLRISIFRFTKELLRDRERTVGRYDSRLEGIDPDAAGESPDYDPSYASVQGAYTAAFNDYVRTELNWQSDMPYEILTGKVQPWNYSEFTNRYVNVADRLASAMAQNQSMRVMVANGYYDLATPFFATEYTFHHMGLDLKLQKNVTMSYCEAGHMLYTKQSCLSALHQNMAGLYSSALGR